MEESLKKKTVKGAAWSGLENFANLGAAFVFGIIMARILVAYLITLVGFGYHIVTLIVATLAWFIIYIGLSYLNKSSELKEVIDIIKRR